MIAFAKSDNNKQYISISTWAKDRRLIGNLYDYISERYPSIKSAPLKMDDDEIAISLDNSGSISP